MRFLLKSGLLISVINPLELWARRVKMVTADRSMEWCGGTHCASAVLGESLVGQHRCPSAK